MALPARHCALLAVTALIGASVAVGLAGAPAQADEITCIEYLEQNEQNTTVRELACLTTFELSRTVSPQVAYDYCVTTMSLTLLTATHTENACQEAITQA